MNKKKIDLVVVATFTLIAVFLIYMAWELSRGWG